MKAEEKGLRLGRYRLQRRIANGGMGQVFSALQTGPGGFEREVAVKLLLSHLDEEPNALQMFLDEARLASRMSHRAIVQIFDVGLEDGRHFIAMELVHGMNLSKLLAASSAAGEWLPPEVILYVARALFTALEHAHGLRGTDGVPLDLVHRDVSPQNLLASVTGEVKLTDFGIAKARDTLTHTRPGLVKGKWEYLAPEQFEDGPVDRRVDLNAAGLTLFQLCTHRSPFRRDSDAATMRAIREEPLPSLIAVRPDLPPELVTVVERATRKLPAERLSTAAEALALLPPGDERRAQAVLAALVARFLPAEPTSTPRAGTAALSEEASLGSAPTLGDEANGATEAAQPATAQQQRTRIGFRRGVGFGLGAALVAVAVAVALAWGLRREEAPTPVASSPVTSPTSPAPVLPTPPAAVEQRAEPELAGRPPVRAPAPVAGKRAAAPRERPRATGFLTVNALPWATVFRGKQRLGETPLHRLPVDEGNLELEFHNPETGKRERRAVRIQPGRETKVRVDLR